MSIAKWMVLLGMASLIAVPTIVSATATDPVDAEACLTKVARWCILLCPGPCYITGNFPIDCEVGCMVDAGLLYAP